MTDHDANPRPPDTPTGASRSLGAFIRAQRKRSNLSLRQLSTKSQISNAYLSQIERDLHEPSIRVLRRVGDALGLEPESLLARAGLLPGSRTDAVGADRGQDGSLGGSSPPPSTEDAILADPHLSDDEKQALVTVYRSYRSKRP